MNPGPVDIGVTQGGAFRDSYRWTRRTPPSTRTIPVPLADGRARAQIRIGGRLALTFDSDPDALDRDGTITLQDDGSITLYAAADVVSAAPAGTGDWSLEVEPAGEDRVVLLAGRATIIAETTR